MQPDSQTASPAKPAPAKPQSSGAPSQSLQELSVREEQGQTTLLVKFAQPVTQYRHFTLPQPARIVLDILDANKVTAADETYRIDTNWVSTLRLNANDRNLRLVAEISAAYGSRLYDRSGGWRIEDRYRRTGSKRDTQRRIFTG